MSGRLVYKVVFCLLLVTQGVQQVCAQDFKQVVEQLRQKYDGMEKFHLIMSIAAFEDSVTTRAYYEERAEIKKDGTNYRYFFGTNEMLLNERYLVVVDKGARDIVCSARDVKAETDFFKKNPVKLNMDSLVNSNSESSFVGHEDGKDHYKVMMKSGAIKRVDMFVVRDGNVLSSIRYTYAEGQCVKIGFEKFDAKPVFGVDDFNESVYMSSAQGKLVPSEAFKRYTLSEVKN